MILTADSVGWPMLYRHVLVRDGRCVFAYLPAALRIGEWPIDGVRDHWCRGKYGEPINWHRIGSILELAGKGHVELNHVKLDPKMGQKAPDSEAHLATVCYGAHHVSHEATSEAGLEFQRRGLAAMYPQAWREFTARQEAVDGTHD